MRPSTTIEPDASMCTTAISPDERLTQAIASMLLTWETRIVS